MTLQGAENKMQTETIDRLFLELSQVSKATTAKELELQREVRWLREALVYGRRHYRRLVRQSRQALHWN